MPKKKGEHKHVSNKEVMIGKRTKQRIGHFPEDRKTSVMPNGGERLIVDYDEKYIKDTPGMPMIVG